MVHEIIMPKAGMAMETGTIVQWFKEEGDEISSGEVLLEIETDKVVMDVEAEFDGFLLKKIYQEDTELPVTTVIGYIGDSAEESIAETVDTSDEAAVCEDAAAETSPAADTPENRDATDPVPALQTGKVRSVPAARKFASEQGIDISQVAASGNKGEITLRDVQHHAESDPDHTAGEQLSLMRRRIASAMTRSHTEVPAFTMQAKADAGKLLKTRESLNLNSDIKISINDMLIDRAAAVLGAHPTLRSSVNRDRIIVHENIHIGFAVALSDGNGLVVPVIRDADKKNLNTIAKETADLIDKARSGTLAAGDTADAVFTITNLGMYGVTGFTPIINLPQSAILGVGTIEKCLQFEDAEIVEKQLMTFSLTVDHRIIDGAAGAKFLRDLVNEIEK